MNCPCCGAELIWSDYWWKGVKGNKEGDIYTCPNAEGFENIGEAVVYAIQTLGYSSLEEAFRKEGIKSIEELTCSSNTFNVCGSFYTTSDGELHEGYPC